MSFKNKDIDECSKGQHDCDDAATCQNTVGDFMCTCLQGEISDGKACAGTNAFLHATFLYCVLEYLYDNIRSLVYYR